MRTRKRSLLWAAVGVALGAVSADRADGSIISGSVVKAESSEDPIVGARVTVFDPALAFFAETRSDGAGDYSLASIPHGTYQIGCAALGRDYLETTVTVDADPLNQDFELEVESHPGQWDIIGTTAPEFLDATDIGVLLDNGMIFYCHDTTDPIVFDPVTGNKYFPSGSPSASGCMNGTLLSDGRVITVGGQDGSDPGDFVSAVPWVKTYTPDTETWALLPDMQLAAGRWYPGLARLADGSLLVMRGGTCCRQAGWPVAACRPRGKIMTAPANGARSTSPRTCFRVRDRRS